MTSKITVSKPQVLRDSQEKAGHGWNFADSDWCSGTTISNLFTGDYTLSGFEKEIIIERKGRISEFAGNIFEKRFADEIDRLVEFKHRFLILEFDMNDIMIFPNNSGIPKHLWKKLKVNTGVMLERIQTYQIKYGIQVFLTGEHGKRYATGLFKRFLECQKKK